MMDAELRQQLQETYPEWVEPVGRLFELHERGQQTFREFVEMRRRAEEWLPRDERLNKAEDQLLKVGNLVQKADIPMLVETHVTLQALKESDARLYGSLQELTEAQKKTDQQLRELAEAQKRTEESLRRFIEHSGNGHGS